MKVNKNKFSSKNLSTYIYKKLNEGGDLDEKIALSLINDKSLEKILPNIYKKLKLRFKNDEVYNSCIVESKTSLDKENLKNISKYFNLPEDKIEVKVNKDMDAGFKLTYKDKIVDATLSKMIKNKLSKVL